MIGLAVLAAAASAQPGAPKIHADWAAGCDNGRACQAVGLMPEDDIAGTTMVVRRGAEAGAVPDVRITIHTGTAASLAIDGRALAVAVTPSESRVTLTPRDARTLLRAALTGQQLTVHDRTGKPVGTVSLNGLTAALIHIDDAQRRIGTVTALARPGKAPASRVPPAPALPVIRRPAASALPARALMPGNSARETAALACEPGQQSGLDAVTVRLDAATSLALLPFPCENGAYNYFAYALLIAEDGRVRPARFDAPPGLDASTENVVVNGEWDAAERLLVTRARGRGLGDCGTISAFAWDGGSFRLARREEMPVCRGSADFISTWRATIR